jgi:aryl-alcohol dehydrogenase-like predicted oxidoreductase
MEKRALGRSGLIVSALSFGAMTFNRDSDSFFAATGTTSGREAERIVDICLDRGITTFDTADVYAGGQSEEILGEVLGKKRKRMVLATKAFGDMGKGDHDLGLSRRHLIDACDASLRRLGTDWIDIYQVHNFDGTVPLEETLRALDDLVRAGKVRYIGCSNHGGWQLMKALGISDRLGLERYIGQQIQYSLLVRDAEWELLPCGLDQGVGALIWSPLAQGFLSGKFRTQGPEGTRLGARGGLKAWDTPRGNAVLDEVLAVARECDATASQVALAWVMRRPGVSSVIVGARTEEQLVDNLGAVDVSLSDEQMVRLDLASQPPIQYPNSHQRFYGRDRNPQAFARYKG